MGIRNGNSEFRIGIRNGKYKYKHKDKYKHKYNHKHKYKPFTEAFRLVLSVVD